MRSYLRVAITANSLLGFMLSSLLQTRSDQVRNRQFRLRDSLARRQTGPLGRTPTPPRWPGRPDQR
ncbi:hypothetical protein BIW11_12671 [Tropilaelaps mercedesae]|uniref:Uncharacterized protein n=1 Tax=Tropilaelaps mercedesae TaxID=418985 RepID=A0A1V9X5U9_9ACAR|nr:hypothetical protein BIW11_12671 [Tropilaelaps mercedesae]